MRVLTAEEIECVAGGTPTIVVTAPNAVTMDPYGDFIFPQYISPPQWFGGGYDTGGSVDRSDLSPSPSIDLSDTDAIEYDFTGHHIEFIIDNKDLPHGSEERRMAIDIIDNIYRGYDSMDMDAKEKLTGLDTVIFTDVPNRSFSDETRGAFYFDISEIKNSSIPFAASNVLHDAVHNWIFQTTGDLNQSRGTASEIAGWQSQLNNAAAFGLSAAEISYLQGLIDNPGSQDPRVNQPPY